MMKQTLSLVILVRQFAMGAYDRVWQWRFGDSWVYGPFPETRWQKVKRKTIGFIERHTPDWVGYFQQGHFLVKTRRGEATLNRLAKAIPDKLFKTWQGFSVRLLALCTVLWIAVLGLVFISTVDLLIESIRELATEGIQVEMATDVEQQNQSSWTLSKILFSLAVFPVQLLLAILITNAILLFLIPGLVLHEFGHYVGLARADIAVESYGLLFFGPFIAGAFVQPSDELEDADTDTQLAVLAGGIANDLVYGVSLLVVSILLFANPITALSGGAEMASNPVAYLLFGLGCVELFLAFTNAFPAGPVDGGRFIQVAEEKYATDANQT